MSWANVVKTRQVAPTLERDHYLGPLPNARGFAWEDEFGVMVLCNPTSRHLPQHRWLELARWCLVGGTDNGGSRQWAAFIRWARANLGHVTTIVSYSDPDAGHTGALYRACNWLWAPTWHRLRPPPTGNGAWSGVPQSVKDRWVFPIKPDPERQHILHIGDSSVRRHFPGAEYEEPCWKYGRRQGGGGDWKRWRPEPKRELA